MSKRKRRLIISSLIIGLPLVTFLIVNAVLVYRSDCEVAARLEAIRAAGDPVTMDDLKKDENLPPEEDARTILENIEDMGSEMCGHIWDTVEEMKDPRDAPPPFSTGFEGYFVPYPFDSWPPETPPNKGTKYYSTTFYDPLPAIRKALRAKGWKRKVEKWRSGEGWNVATRDDGPLTTATGLLQHHSQYCLANDRVDEAVEDLISILRLTNKYTNGQYLSTINMSVLEIRQSTHWRINGFLQQRELPKELVDRIDSALAETNYEKICEESMKAERAEMISRVRADGQLASLWLFRPLWNRKMLKTLDVADGLVRNARRIKCYRGDPEGDALETLHGVCYRWNEIIYPMIQSRALRILIALKRMDDPEALLEEDGTLDPRKLNLPEESVMDPCNEKPLIVRRVRDGWLIYSVGDNQIDDGGTDIDMRIGADIGIGPWHPVPVR